MGKERLRGKIGEFVFGNTEKAATRRIYIFGGLGLIGIATSYGLTIVSLGALLWSIRERSRLGDREIKDRNSQRALRVVPNYKT